MTKQGRGWDFEAHVPTETTTGQPVDFSIGITRDPRHPGRQVVGVAIGNGPTAVLRLDGDVGNGTDVIEKIRHALAELLKLDRRGGV